MGNDGDDLAGACLFRAVAIDYDGTLADGQVKPDTLAALAEARARQTGAPAEPVRMGGRPSLPARCMTGGCVT